jgi:hypothetical protein
MLAQGRFGAAVEFAARVLPVNRSLANGLGALEIMFLQGRALAALARVSPE